VLVISKEYYKLFFYKTFAPNLPGYSHMKNLAENWDLPNTKDVVSVSSGKIFDN
jgi:hypothetical protein